MAAGVSGKRGLRGVTTLPVEHRALVCGDLIVYPQNRRATVDKKELKLSRKKFALLAMPAGQPDRVFTVEEFLVTGWGDADDTRIETLRSHIRNLRASLKEAGVDGMVINSWGVGYRLWDRPDLVALPALPLSGERA